MRRAAKIDDNQREVVNALRQLPQVTVALTAAVGKGVPDFVVGYKGNNYWIELKDGNKPPSQRKLTEHEEAWHEKWTGHVAICNNLDEVLKEIGYGSR